MKEIKHKKYVRHSIWDYNSVSLFDYNRKNEFGKMYCVAAGILPREVDWYWSEYIKNLN